MSSSRTTCLIGSESSQPPVTFQFDNARKRAIRLAKEQSEQSSDNQGEQAIPAPYMVIQPGLQQHPWVPLPAPPSVSDAPPPEYIGLLPPKDDGNDRNRRVSRSGPSSKQSAEGMDVLEERKKDREERRQERVEREQERAVRARELQEREHEREERRKEREERQLEREERRREVEERVQIGGSAGSENALAKRILDLELKNGALNSKVEALTNELKSVKETSDAQFRIMKQALEAEQKKINALVEHTKLFQFSDKKVNFKSVSPLVRNAAGKLAVEARPFPKFEGSGPPAFESREAGSKNYLDPPNRGGHGLRDGV